MSKVKRPRLDYANIQPDVSYANVEDLMKKSFKLLKESIAATAENDTKTNSGEELSPVKRKIQITKEKIKYCLESVKKLNESKSDPENLPLEQANILIYFLEALALNGSCDEEVKNEVKKHFSQYYSEDDRQLISTSRNLFLKEKSAFELKPEDVLKLVSEDVNKFVPENAFRYLQKYLEQINEKIKNKRSSSNDRKIVFTTEKAVKEETVKLSCFFKELKGKGKDRDIGRPRKDPRSYLNKEFQKLIIAAYRHQKLTPEEIFDFIMNFYPALKQEIKNDFKELQDIRNSLIHEFHEYGHVEFENEIYSLRSKMLKYYFAQEVLQVLGNIELDDSSGTFSRNLKEKLKIFQEEFERSYGTTQFISHEDVKNSFGFVFANSVLPEREDSVEYLVDQYMKFMIIFDREEKEENDFIRTVTDDSANHPHRRRKELNDADRREIFEELVKLKCMKNKNTLDYNIAKGALKDKTTNVYGVSEHHFDTICLWFVENDKGFGEKDNKTVKKIANTINYLKKRKDEKNLSNHLIVSFYDDLLKESRASVSAETHSSLINTTDPATEQEIKSEGLKDEILNISINNESFFFRKSTIIRNILKTFDNAYHKYQVKFSIEELFNDDVFLDYLVTGQTQESDVKEINSEILLVAFIDSRKKRNSAELAKSEIISTRKVLQDFCRLKMFKKHCSNQDCCNEGQCKEILVDICNQDYCKEKENVKAKIVKEIGLEECDFDKACEFFTDNDSNLTKEDKMEIAKVEEILNEFKNHGKSWQTVAFSYQELIKEKRKETLLDEDQNLAGASKREVKKLKSKLEKLYTDRDLARSEVNMEFQQIKSPTWKVIYDVLGILKGQRQFEKPHFIYMIIKKILNIDYCVPFIVKLITEVRNDSIIEKSDLLKLVGILLKKGDLYIKHLRELLNIGSRKLNLYEGICNEILKHDMNVESLRMMLKDPYHTNAILDIIKRKIGSPFDSEEFKFKKFINNVFKLLNCIAYEFYRYNNPNAASKILEAASSVHEKLIHYNIIEKTDLNILETRFQIGRVTYKEGMQERALEIFDNILMTLQYQEDGPQQQRDLKFSEIPLLLLVHAEKAYTKALMEKYESSCTELENLCQEVAKFVFVLQFVNVLNLETYKKIQESERYQILLNFSEESKKYLDILNIKSAVAFCKVRHASREVKNKHFCNAEDLYCDAQEIYQKVYEIKNTVLHQTISATMSDISYVLAQIARVKEMQEKPDDAFCFRYNSLEMEIKAYEKKIAMFWLSHKAVIKSRTRIINALESIAKVLLNVRRKTSPERKYETALQIHEGIYEILKQSHGEQHCRTASTMYNIGEVLYKLQRLEKAKYYLSEACNIQTEVLGNDNKKTRRTKNLLEEVKTELRNRS